MNPLKCGMPSAGSAENVLAAFGVHRPGQPHEGLLQFKHGRIAVEKSVFYYVSDLKTSTFVAHPPAVETSYGILNLMPVPVLRFTGSLFYRHTGLRLKK